jgi:isopentenyl-diphosphate delta-isomerase
MTGGTDLTKSINIKLAKVADKFNIPMMVGSQRVILRHPEAKTSFSVIRDHAPNVPMISNIGLAQIANSENFDYIPILIDNIKADALAIHLNAIQEVIQPEGDKKFAGALEKIRELKKQISIPIIIKETGCGISKETAKKIIENGVRIIDVAGVGGTSWVAVEYYRAKEHQELTKEKLGKLFWDWGIPTAASILEVKKYSIDYTDAKIIASGGIRTGIDIAKSLRLGADYAAMARPLLLETLKNENSLFSFVEQKLTELRITMLLTGSRDIYDLEEAPVVISGKLKNWIEERMLKLF